MEAYSELRGGRFLVIADFEEPGHMELFEMISVSPQAKLELSEKRGRPRTGPRCLEFTTGSPDDAIVVSNARAENWYLKRDWRPYDLLLMSVNVPGGKRRSGGRDLALEVTIAAGSASSSRSEPRPSGSLGEAVPTAVQCSIPLQPGWNVVRLDLAEVGERIPLDDVRELRLAVSGPPRPRRKAMTVRIDDILLTGLRRDLFGDSSNQDGGVYVQRVGRRCRVGAGGRFELVFANGQIVEWYNLAADPYRRRNLVQGTTLGPSPMVLGSPQEREAGFSPLGEDVLVWQRILEMNVVRVVVACTWWFVDDPNAAVDDRPYQRWVYTIYPTGQIYVAVEHTAATEQWSPSELGLAVTVASSEDDERRLYQSVVGGSPTRQEPRVPFATVRNHPNDSFLLFALGKRHESARIAEIVDPSRARVSLVAAAGQSGLDMDAWACQILVGGAVDISDEEAAARVADYAVRSKISFKVGSLAKVDDMSIGGLDAVQASGCYVIAPDQGRVLFSIDGRERPSYSPAFRIISATNQDAWVYVNHLVFDRIARDAAGNVLFQLPSTITRPTIVEVLIRRPEPPAGS
jgi:hypothetical protein